MIRASIITLIIITTAILTGCTNTQRTGLHVLPSNWGKEEGHIWCNSRYLHYWAYPESISADPSKDVRLALSSKGYIYALVAGLALQKPYKSEDKHFYLPEYLVQIDALETDDQTTGFQASTYEYRDPKGSEHINEIIVVFRGSDEWRDYWKHNFSLRPKQYLPAREYIMRVKAKYSNMRIVVSGFSLGGGLAVHVANHPDTADKVDEVWALNPSPRTGVKNTPNPKVHLAAVHGEILNVFRTDSMGANPGNYSNEFGLVKSSSIYGHSRWVLIRQMLFFADMVEYERSGRTVEMTQPLEIIMKSNVPKGCPKL